jgi:hypothetical protein
MQKCVLFPQLLETEFPLHELMGLDKKNDTKNWNQNKSFPVRNERVWPSCI